MSFLTPPANATQAQLVRRIRGNWPAIVAASGCYEQALFCLPKGNLKLPGESEKTKRQDASPEAVPVLIAVVYMMPADGSGRNVCPLATAECRGACLGDHSGRMVFKSVKASQLWKTTLRFGAPELYFALLALQIAAHERKAAKLGLESRVRLDGTSDLGDAARMAALFPNTGFYDYTKIPRRAARWLRSGRPNLRATLSFSGYNWAECAEYLAAGGTVAVATTLEKKAPKPSEFRGFPTVDGDATDNRFNDPAGHVVLLSWKGPRTLIDGAGPFAVEVAPDEARMAA